MALPGANKLTPTNSRTVKTCGASRRAFSPHHFLLPEGGAVAMAMFD